tara:strand:+ start:3007 stop:3456 length:450 start_codon:yes stop_codon:yes gene_type:complete
MEEEEEKAKAAAKGNGNSTTMPLLPPGTCVEKCQDVTGAILSTELNSNVRFGLKSEGVVIECKNTATVSVCVVEEKGKVKEERSRIEPSGEGMTVAAFRREPSHPVADGTKMPLIMKSGLRGSPCPHPPEPTIGELMSTLNEFLQVRHW